MKILIFGNPVVKRDNLALRLITKLRKSYPKIEFKEFDPTESLEKEIENGSLFILDVAEGIKEVKVIDNLDELKIIKSCSMHDFDLTYNLKLLKKIDMIYNIKIIAIPLEISEKEAVRGVNRLLKKYL